MEYKQVIVFREDLKLSTGKLAVQAAHASLLAFKKADKKICIEWEHEGMKKIALQVKNENELLKLFETAKKFMLPAALVKDAGLTEVPAGTTTALGIGPANEKDIDKLTRSLPLLD